MTPVDIPAPEDSGNTVSPQAFVYVITAESDAVKIGLARDTWRRLRELQTGHYKKLSIAHQIGFATGAEAFAVERRAHKLLSANRAEGEWFNVSPDQAKAAVEEQAISEIREGKRLEEEAQKRAETTAGEGRHVYRGPEITEAPPWMREPKDIIRFVLGQKDQLERKFLFDFGDCVLFVDCRRDDETGLYHFFMNDVTRWHMCDGEGRPCDGKTASNPLGNPACAFFATVLQPMGIGA